MLDLFNVLKGIECNAENATACGSVIGAGIPGSIVNIIHYVYLGIQIIVPIMLIIFGMLDLAKALSAQKEDEIKKAQSGLIKKAITAVLVFLIFSLVRFVFNFAGGEQNVWGCVDNIINGTCDVGSNSTSN